VSESRWRGAGRARRGQLEAGSAWRLSSGERQEDQLDATQGACRGGPTQARPVPSGVRCRRPITLSPRRSWPQSPGVAIGRAPSFISCARSYTCSPELRLVTTRHTCSPLRNTSDSASSPPHLPTMASGTRIRSTAHAHASTQRSRVRTACTTRMRDMLTRAGTLYPLCRHDLPRLRRGTARSPRPSHGTLAVYRVDPLLEPSLGVDRGRRDPPPHRPDPHPRPQGSVQRPG